MQGQLIDMFKGNDLTFLDGVEARRTEEAKGSAFGKELVLG